MLWFAVLCCIIYIKPHGRMRCCKWRKVKQRGTLSENDSPVNHVVLLAELKLLSTFRDHFYSFRLRLYFQGHINIITLIMFSSSELIKYKMIINNRGPMNWQCCAWTRSVNDCSWARSCFGQMYSAWFCLIVIVNAFIVAFVNSALKKKVLLHSRECQLSIEPSRRKPAKTHHQQALICSGNSPNLATPSTTESSHGMHHQNAKHWGKNKGRSRVGGWCAAETLSELRRRLATVWRTALSETVNSQRSRSHPGRCTGRPQIALSSGQRGGFSSTFYPLASSLRAEGLRLCLCLCQTKMDHAVPETMALSQLNYGCTIL